MKRSLSVLLFLILLVNAIIPVEYSWAKIPPDELMVEGKPIIQEKGGLRVTWVLVKQAPFVIDVTVENLLSKPRKLNIASLLDSFNVPLRKAELYIQRNVSYDLNKIVWEEAKGARGPFEIAREQENSNNVDYKALLEDLRAHKGRMRHEGYFIWLFKDETAIGRKIKQKTEKKDGLPLHLKE